MHVLQKGIDVQLDLFGYLYSREIDCHCHSDSCCHILVSKRLINAFMQLRHEYGSPITITSGFRCQWWNDFVGGVNSSAHTIGCAIDTKGTDMDRLFTYAQEYFKYVEWNKEKGYIHCHVDYN